MINVHKYLTSIYWYILIYCVYKVYIDKSDDMVNRYNNTHHSTIKMHAVDINSSTYIDFNKENNKEDQFEVADDVRISKYENIFTNVYTPNWYEEVPALKKPKILYRTYMLLVILTAKKILECLMK